MLAAAVVLLLAQAPQPVTLMEGGWVATGVDGPQLTLWNEVLFSELAALGVTVRTSGDVAQALGIERQKQLLGCSDEGTRCIAEIAQALNADAIIRGSTGRSGSSLVLNVRVLSASGQPLAVKSSIVPTVDLALREMKPIAQALVQALAAHFPGRIALKAKVTPGLGRFWWAPASAAVVFAGLGTAAQLSARGIEQDVRTRGLAAGGLTEVRGDLERGGQLEALSFVGFAVAGAAIAGTVGLVWLGQDTVEPLPVALVPGPGGAVLVGRWP